MKPRKWVVEPFVRVRVCVCVGGGGVRERGSKLEYFRESCSILMPLIDHQLN